MPEQMKEMADKHAAAAKVYSAIDQLNEAIKEAGHLKLTVEIEEEKYSIDTGPAIGHIVPYLMGKVLIEL